MREQWRPISGFEDRYEVSNRGRVKSIWYNGPRSRPKILRHTTSASRYPQVNLARNNTLTTRRVHCLVLQAFVGPAPAGHVACHKNGKRSDNRWPQNIRWDTPFQNLVDDVKNGTRRRLNEHKVLTAPDLAAEKWLDLKVNGRDTILQISNMARFRHRVTQHIATPQYTAKGFEIRPIRFLDVPVSQPASTTTCCVAPLVAEYFLGPKPTSQHKLIRLNHVKTDVRASNLRWASLSEVMQHRNASPSRPKYRNGPRLGERKYLQIQGLAAQGTSYSEIARRLECSTSIVSKIARGLQRWKSGRAI